MKIKPILPSLKENRRYLVYETIGNISQEEAKMALNNGIKDFIGQLGLAKAGLIHINEYKNNKGIISINNKSVDEVKMALSLIKEVDGKKVIFKCNGVSGILNKAKLKFMG